MSRNESIGYLTSVLYRKNQLYLNQALKPFDLSSSEMLILHRLCTHGECSQEEVASHLMIDKAAITRAVQSLEKKGWLTRSRSETDKRAFILKPLQKSYDHQTEFLSIMSYWTEFLTDGMSREEVTVLFRNDDADHAVCWKSGICDGGTSRRAFCHQRNYRGWRYPVLLPVYP